ncbi:MAG: TraR/DksA C4-type zinc finger protein [Planctomycetaceae bacterium]|nr:TraR/DksA C4-type zinc finger protein [Planctomycetaceae bacterium]
MRGKQTLLRIRQNLIRQRDALRKKLAEQSDWIDPEAAHGDLGDAALLDYEQEMHSQLAALESRELDRLERAIHAIETGRYGTCEHCQQKIPLARLRAIPDATTCIRCQQKSELSRTYGHEELHWEAAWDYQAREHDQELTVQDVSMED